MSELQHVEDPSSDFSQQLACLRTPEAVQLVADFQKNVFDLLVNKVKWRVKSESNQDGSATQPESLDSADLPETLKVDAEFCKNFASSLILKDEVENGCFTSSAAAVLRSPLLLEVDDGGKMELNPFKLVAVLGQKLTLAAQLMEEIKDGSHNKNCPEDDDMKECDE